MSSFARGIDHNEDALSSLISLMQESIEAYSPGEFSSYAAKWKQAFWEKHNRANDDYMKTLIDIGANHIDFNNCELAEYYLDEARIHIKNIYGPESFLAKYILRFYAWICYLQGDYLKCIEYTEAALFAINDMKATSVSQQFFDIYEGRNEHFDNVYVLNFRAHMEQTNITGEESPSAIEFLFKMLASSGINESAVLEHTEAAAATLGIPPHIYSMIKSRLFQSVQSLGAKKTFQLTKAMTSMWRLEKDWEGKNVDQATDVVRFKAIQAYSESYVSMVNIFGADNLIGKLLKASIDNLIFTFLPGYIKIGYPQKTIEYYELNQDMPMNAVGSLSALIWKCIAHDQLNDHENVQQCLQTILEGYQHIVSQMLLLFDEEKQIEFLAAFQSQLHCCLYLLLRHRGVDIAYSFHISYKMLSYDYSSISKRYLKGHPKYQEIIRLKRNSTNGQLTHAMRQAQAGLLEDISETDIYNDLFSVSIDDVRGNIDDGCVLVEFAKVYRDVEMASYAAFVLTAAGATQYVELGDCEVIDEQISNFVESVIAHETHANIYETNAFFFLCKTIIQPVLSRCLAKPRKLFVAPVGALFSLPFDLFTERKVIYIDSGRGLVKTNSSRSPAIRTALIAGAPDYPDERLPELPTSFYETSVIASIIGCKPVTHGAARRSIFDYRYQYIHLSAHGDYTPSSDQDFFSDSFLLLSNNEKVTARELSLKDFSGTELVTLAACCSGLGRMTDIEGVLGIRRAFLKAGAKHVIATLWHVPDIASSILMVNFYENHIRQRMNLCDALRHAKQYVKNLTAQEAIMVFNEMSGYLGKDVTSELYLGLEDCEDDYKPFSDPYYWAAFILVESQSWTERGCSC